MTPAERKQVEAELIMDIVCGASKRIRSEDTEDPIRTEVEERLQQLIGSGTKTVVDNQKPRSNRREIHFKGKDGRTVWCGRDEAVKVVRNGAGCPWKWVLKSELTDEDVLYEEPT